MIRNVIGLFSFNRESTDSRLVSKVNRRSWFSAWGSLGLINLNSFLYSQSTMSLSGFISSQFLLMLEIPLNWQYFTTGRFSCLSDACWIFPLALDDGSALETDTPCGNVKRPFGFAQLGDAMAGSIGQGSHTAQCQKVQFTPRLGSFCVETMRQ